jgi:glycosyltransferase involved in cell wall biosynthesis
MYSMADVVFTVTNDLRTFHGKQAWLEADDFRVIYNGVDTDRFAPRPGDAARLRLEFAIPQDRVVIGSVGRLVPIKDHPTLLRAAERLLRAGRNVHVLVAGAGPDLEKLKAQVATSEVLRERVTFVGATDRVPELMNAMDVFVLPSICEGMSNTILEAMASGLPVVATSAGGNPELVENGQSGLLFSPSCVESLTQHLVRLTDDSELRTQLGKDARQRAVNLFSLSGMIQRYRDLYLELTARRVNRGKESK